MSVLAAILLAFAVLASQVLHGGLLVPAFTIPSLTLLTVAAAVALLSLRKNPAPGSMAGMLTVVAFAAYVGWRCLNAPDPYLGGVDLRTLALGTLAFFVSAVGLRDNRARLTFVVTMLAVAAVQAGVGVVQFARTDFVAPLGWFSDLLEQLYGDRFANRAHGTFLNPNQLAWLTTWAALFSLSLACWGRTTVLVRLLLGYFALVFVATTVITGSRGGMASSLVGLTWFAILSGLAICAAHRTGRLRLVTGTLALLILCVGAGYAVYSSNWMAQGRVDATLTVDDPRAVLLENGWRQFQTAPLFGAGPQMFLYAARAYRTGGQEGDPIFAHNDWLQALTDYGIIGFGLALLTLIVLLMGGTLRLVKVVIRQAEVDERPFSNSVAVLAGGISALTAFAVHSFTDFNLHVPANAILAGATLGLLTGTAGRFAETAAGKILDVLRRVAAGVCLIAFAAGSGWLVWKNAIPDYDALAARNALLRGDVFGSLEISRRGLEKAPDNVPLLLVQGEGLYSYLSAAMEADQPVSPPLTPSRLREVFAESVKNYERAIELQPRESATRIALSRSLEELKRYREAEKQLVEAIALEPQHSSAFSAYADFLYDHGRVPRTVRILEVASTLPPWQVPADRLLEIQEELNPAAEDSLPSDSEPEGTEP